MLILMGVWMLVGLTGGLIENPLMAGVSMPIRMALGGLMSAASGPAVVWIFLRTRSAVIPALAQTSFQTMLAAATVMLSDINPTLGLPTGAIAILIALVTGVALWVWKDPGGESLAIAAVANDGTPLTAQQVGAMDAPVQVPPPPPQA